MRMYTEAANDMRQINQIVNEKGLTPDQIVNIFQNKDGLYVLVYFSE